MKFLLVHNNFPAQYQYLIRMLRHYRHEIVFMSRPNDNRMQSVRKVDVLVDDQPNPNTLPAARAFEMGLRRAEAVAQTAARVKAEGFSPDMIIGHHGWGDLLDIGDVWPNVPLLGYFEFYYREPALETGFDPLIPAQPGAPARVRGDNAINHTALTNPGRGQTPTEFQLQTYPEMFRSKIELIREGVDLDVCKPDPTARLAPLDLAAMITDPTLASGGHPTSLQPTEQLVTYINQFMEPARGLQAMVAAIPQILERPNTRVVIVGRDDKKGYGPLLENATWKTYFLNQIRGRYDESRLHFLGIVSHADHLRLLRRSDCHVFLTYPFVVSWSLREALACGCAVVASDTISVHEFIRPGWNGILTDFFDHAALATRVLEVLKDPDLSVTLRTNARADAEKNLSLRDTLRTYAAVIDRLTGRGAVAAAPS